MKAKEFIQALRDAKLESPNAVRLSNGWYVTAQKIYPQPARPGPAWSWHFFVKSPTGKTFGGQTRMDSLTSYFCNPNFFQWVDDYRGNGAGKTA